MKVAHKQKIVVIIFCIVSSCVFGDRRAHGTPVDRDAYDDDGSC